MVGCLCLVYPTNVWDVPDYDSPARVIGETSKEMVYVVVEENLHEVKVLLPDGTSGWIQKHRIFKLVQTPRAIR